MTMTIPCLPAPGRRRFLLGGVTALGAAGFRSELAQAATDAATAGPTAIRLVARSGHVSLAGPPHPETQIWGYDGQIPGPEIRVRQGDRLRVLLENRPPRRQRSIGMGCVCRMPWTVCRT